MGNDVRFDFETVALFPDGSDTKVTGPSDGPAEPQVVGTAQGPTAATVIVPSPGAGQIALQATFYNSAGVAGI